MKPVVPQGMYIYKNPGIGSIGKLIYKMKKNISNKPFCNKTYSYYDFELKMYTIVHVLQILNNNNNNKDSVVSPEIWSTFYRG